MTDFSSIGETPIKISYFTLTFFRMNAQLRIKTPPTITLEKKIGQMASLMDVEVEHCAAVIVAAFLNPSKSI